MKKIDLGQTIGILANVGVIAGLLLLVLELQQNNRLLAVDAAGALIDRHMLRNQEIMINEEFASLLAKNLRGQELSDVELIRIEAFFSFNLLGRHKEYKLYQAGVVSEEEMRAYLNNVRSGFSAPGISNASRWPEVRDAFPRDFQRFIDECVVSTCDSIPR